MNEWMNEWVNEWLNEKMNEWLNEKMNEVCQKMSLSNPQCTPKNDKKDRMVWKSMLFQRTVTIG